MLISFSKKQSFDRSAEDSRSDSYRALTDYMDGEFVVKPVNGKRLKKPRDPVPEILFGSASVLRRSIASLSFSRKYHFGLMSFAAEDIDFKAFNDGDPILRKNVCRAFELFLEVYWPGVPRSARPVVYSTTHTHTERLEVNFAVPNCIRSGSRGIVTYNPDPPWVSDQPSRLWVAARDLLNSTFQWADPNDPTRERPVKRPNWILKQEAEANRSGVVPIVDPRADLALKVEKQLVGLTSPTPEDVRLALQPALVEYGWTVLSERSDGVTVGPVGAALRDRYLLKGKLFSQNFCGDVTAEKSLLAEKCAQRAAELSTAQDRLQTAWNARASYNLERYGQGTWPKPEWTVERWLEDASQKTFEKIPLRNVARIISPNRKLGGLDDQHDTHSNGATVLGVSEPDNGSGDRTAKETGNPSFGGGGPHPNAGSTGGANGRNRGGARKVGELIGELDWYVQRATEINGVFAGLARNMRLLARLVPTLNVVLARHQFEAQLTDTVASKMNILTTIMKDRADDIKKLRDHRGAGRKAGSEIDSNAVRFDSAALGHRVTQERAPDLRQTQSELYRRNDAAYFGRTKESGGVRPADPRDDHQVGGGPRPSTATTRGHAKEARQNHGGGSGYGATSEWSGLGDQTQRATLADLIRVAVRARGRCSGLKWVRIRGGLRLISGNTVINLFNEQAVVAHIDVENLDVLQVTGEIVQDCLGWWQIDNLAGLQPGDAFIASSADALSATAYEWEQDQVEQANNFDDGSGFGM